MVIFGLQTLNFKARTSKYQCLTISHHIEKYTMVILCLDLGNTGSLSSKFPWDLPMEGPLKSDGCTMVHFATRPFLVFSSDLITLD